MQKILQLAFVHPSRKRDQRLTREEMRVLEGVFRGRPLRAAEAKEVRPSARRTREVVFEFIAPRVVGARFLDLCAGTGSVGVEALSRGAQHVTFVDRSAEACEVVRANLEACGPVARQRADIELFDATEFLRDAAAAEDEAWDVAFFDPPYSMDYAPALELFGSGRVFKRKGGILVVEHQAGRKLPDAIGVLRRWRGVRQGDTCVSFYEQKYRRPEAGKT
jgi:16S rRNA (guanine966-N2)-methyltransferase